MRACSPLASQVDVGWKDAITHSLHGAGAGLKDGYRSTITSAKGISNSVPSLHRMRWRNSHSDLAETLSWAIATSSYSQCLYSWEKGQLLRRLVSFGAFNRK